MLNIEQFASRNETQALCLSAQIMLDCCGYDDYQKTHPNCDQLQNCKTVIQPIIHTILYVIGAVFGGFFIFTFLLCIPGCVRMRSFHRFH